MSGKSKRAILSLLVSAVLFAITACPGLVIDHIQITFAGGAAVIGASGTFTCFSPTANGVIAYHWSFGDGTTGQGKTMSHTYASSGDFLVECRVLTESSILTFTKSLTIAAIYSTFSKMYWANATSQRILRANLDGTGSEELVCNSGCANNWGGISFPRGIAVDTTAGKMYWTDAGTSRISRSNLDGTGAEDLICNSGCTNNNANLLDPLGIALDLTHGKMYWIDNGTDRVARANLDGGGYEDLICRTGCAINNSLILTPIFIALDVANGKMYWTEDFSHRIVRANLDGTGYEDLICQSGCTHNDASIVDPIGIELDLPAGKMYWTDNTSQRIVRANLDGSSYENLLCNSGCANNNSSLLGPLGFALDLANGKMIWTDPSSVRIPQANLDGTGYADLICQSGCANNNANILLPYGIALGN